MNTPIAPYQLSPALRNLIAVHVILPGHQRLCADGDQQEATQTGRFLAYAARDLVADALREIATAASSCRYRPDPHGLRLG